MNNKSAMSAEFYYLICNSTTLNVSVFGLYGITNIRTLTELEKLWPNEECRVSLGDNAALTSTA